MKRLQNIKDQLDKIQRELDAAYKLIHQLEEKLAVASSSKNSSNPQKPHPPEKERVVEKASKPPEATKNVPSSKEPEQPQHRSPKDEKNKQGAGQKPQEEPKPNNSSQSPDKDKNSSNKETDFKSIDGEEGIFDGFNLVTEDGQKFEVPANYAAKSKLVYGDRLKRIDKNGKKLFKHIDKIDRIKVEGILTKIGEDWFFVCESGQYQISNVAADFQKAEDGVEAICFLPEKLTDATFATLDKVHPKTIEKPLQSTSSSDTKGSEAKPEESAPLEEYNPRVVLDEDLR